MSTWKTGAALALGLAALVGGAATRLPASEGDAPVWLADYETAQTAARQSGKPLFVAFR
jgi:hypothetical protein